MGLKKSLLLIKSERLTLSEKSVTHPLGILYLAAIARKTGVFEPKVLDLRVEKPSEVKGILLSAMEKKPEIVGFSCVSDQISTLRDVAVFMRRHLPQSLFVAGGPLATSDPESVLKSIPIDLCVRGEGEAVFDKLLYKVAEDEDWRDLPSIAFKDGDRILYNQPGEYLQDLDQLPLIPWELLDFEKYARKINFSGILNRYAAIATSRGCPFACIYCHNIFGKKFRAMSPERVMMELEPLYHRYKIRRIEFIDDIFNFDRQRALRILHLIAQNFPKMKVSFPNALRADLLDEEMIAALAEARCYHLSIAIETGSPRLQKLIGKNLNLEKAAIAVKLCKKYKVPTRGFFMVGFPSETDEDLQQTIDFCLNNPFDNRLVFRLTPFMGTKVRELISNGRIPNQKEEYDYFFGQYNFSNASEKLITEFEAKAKVKNLFNRYGFQEYLANALIGLKMEGGWRRLMLALISVEKYRKFIHNLGKKQLQNGFRLSD